MIKSIKDIIQDDNLPKNPFEPKNLNLFPPMVQIDGEFTLDYELVINRSTYPLFWDSKETAEKLKNYFSSAAGGSAD